MNKKSLSYLGLSQKSGSAVTGEDSCEKAIAKGKAELVIIAADASDNTKKKFTNKSEFYKVPYVISGKRDDISAAIGKVNRPTVVVTDKGLAERILLALKE